MVKPNRKENLLSQKLSYLTQSLESSCLKTRYLLPALIYFSIHHIKLQAFFDPTTQFFLCVQGHRRHWERTMELLYTLSNEYNVFVCLLLHIRKQNTASQKLKGP